MIDKMQFHGQTVASSLVARVQDGCIAKKDRVVYFGCSVCGSRHKCMTKKFILWLDDKNVNNYSPNLSFFLGIGTTRF